MENTHMGFDELALNLHITKEQVKNIWNELDLGWHMTPRTLISTRRIGHKHYELLDELVIFIAPATPIVIPKGFITDYASIPRLFLWFIDKDDNGIAIPSLPHDVLRRTKWVSDVVADAIFLQLMRYRRFGKYKRTLAYLAVRLASFFSKQKRDEAVYQSILKATLDYVESHDFRDLEIK